MNFHGRHRRQPHQFLIENPKFREYWGHGWGNKYNLEVGIPLQQTVMPFGASLTLCVRLMVSHTRV